MDIKALEEFVLRSPGNYVSVEDAMTPEAAGMRLFDPPIFGVGDPDDPLFEGLRRPEVVGPHIKLPRDWLPEANSVLSFFLPFSDAVKADNGADPTGWPSPGWLHGRIEGQAFLLEFCRELVRQLEAEGARSVVPALDSRFWSVNLPSPETGELAYTSCWSERHAAFVCGLGTFSLSKGLITEKGVCGRFGSLITTARLPVTHRPYHDVEESCTHCGACARNCPGGAISLEKGKQHRPCYDFQAQVLERWSPRFGCGKCQVAVPCMNGIPGKSKK